MLIAPALLEGVMETVMLVSVGAWDVEWGSTTSRTITAAPVYEVGDHLFVFGWRTGGPQLVTGTNWSGIASVAGLPNAIYTRIATGDSNDDFVTADFGTYGGGNNGYQMCAMRIPAWSNIARANGSNEYAGASELTFPGSPGDGAYLAYTTTEDAGPNPEPALMFVRHVKYLNPYGGSAFTYGITGSDGLTEIGDTQDFISGSITFSVGWAFRWDTTATDISGGSFGQNPDDDTYGVSGGMYGQTLRCEETP